MTETRLDDSVCTLKHLRDVMAEFVQERSWNQFHTPKNLAGSVSIEAAELLELFQWLTTDEAALKAQSDEELREKIGDEMADVFLYLLSMANALDIDLASSTLNKVEKNKLKYPVSLTRR